MKRDTLLIALQHEDAVRLLRGSDVPCSLMEKFEGISLGAYTGGMADRWTWASAGDNVWNKHTIQELWDLYQTIKISELCAKLNAHLPCKTQKDIDGLTMMLKENIDEVPERHIYWSREIFIDAGFKDEQCMNILIHSDNVIFVPSEDPTEHPGIVVRYKYEIEKTN